MLYNNSTQEEQIMRDVKINCDEGKFKFRVCGILKVNNKYLTVKIGDNDFYCLPGGHVELGSHAKAPPQKGRAGQLVFHHRRGFQGPPPDGYSFKRWLFERKGR